VTLNVYNVLGHKIITLLNEELTTGFHKVNFVTKTLSSGVYFYSVESDGEKNMRRMMLMK